MPEEIELYGPEYEEELFKQLYPKMAEQISAQYKNRGVQFGREGGDLAEAENKLRREIKLQVGQQNAQLKTSLMIRKADEEAAIRKESREYSRKMEERGLAQTQHDRDILEARRYLEEQKRDALSKEGRERSYKLTELGIPPTEMSKFYEGSETPDLERANRERIETFFRGANETPQLPGPLPRESMEPLRSDQYKRELDTPASESARLQTPEVPPLTNIWSQPSLDQTKKKSPWMTAGDPFRRGGL